MMSNLLDVRAEEFYEVALVAAKNLGRKYYSVVHYMSPEDIVQDVAIKIIKTDIQFDEERGNFKSFVYLLVSSAYLDNARKIKKHEGCVSLDAEIVNGELGMEDMLDSGYRLDDAIIDLETVDNIIENLPNESNRVGQTPLGIMNMSVRNLIKFKLYGYNAREMSEWFGVKQSNINLQLRKGKRILQEIM